MSTKMESKQLTPSIIARLMGLDEQPLHQPVQKKQRVLSENYLRRVASIGVREKRSSEAHPLFRFGIEEKKEFKDVYEILEKLKKKNDCNLSVETGDANLSLSKVQMPLLRQSFGDGKHVSVDNESQMSKEDRDGLGIVGSKMDLFIKYLQEPGSSSCKHLHDLQGIPGHFQSGQKKVLKSLHASDSAQTDRCIKSCRGTDQGRDKLLPKLQTGLGEDSYGKLGPGKMHKSLRSQNSDNGPCLIPSTKIVVLKPNPGKTDNAARYLLSSTSHGDFHSISKKHTESHSPEHVKPFSQEKEMKTVDIDVEPLRRRSRFSKEIDKQTGHGKISLFTRVSKSGIRDSSTFVKESDLIIFSSPNTSDEENQYEPSFYHSDGSYVAREAKKDIFERWNTNNKFQEVGVTSRGRTLGEVPAIPDHESRHRSLNVRLGEDGCSSQIGLCSDRLMRPLESTKRLQHRSRKQIHNRKDSSESGCRKSQSFACLEAGNNCSARSKDVLQCELKRKLEDKDQCEQTSVVCNSSTHSGLCYDSEHGSSVQESKSFQEEQIMIDIETSEETKDVGMTSENHEEHHFKLTDVSSSVPNTSARQDLSIGISEEDSVSSFCTCTDPESLVNSEEAYQPSPNSVLEPPFEKEISYGSECFRDGNASLHGLQLHLELLKSESEAYSEGTGMIVSSDEDSGEGSVGNYEENEKSMKIFSVEETRDYSYLVDLLNEAGFHGTNLESGYNTRQSPECPVSPTIFEMVEKKYGEQISWKRSDRKLLFDRINSELAEILQPSITTHWIKPVCRRLSYRKSLEGIEDEVWISLVSQEKQANNDSSLKLLRKDDGWLELGDDMEGIVREIENSLIDELATEVVF